MREVTIDAVSPEVLAEVIETVNIVEFYRAIGYLSAWAITGGNYPKLSIWVDRECDLNAIYRKENGEVGYVIGAVWHRDDKMYSFHS